MSTRRTTVRRSRSRSRSRRGGRDDTDRGRVEGRRQVCEALE